MEKDTQFRKNFIWNILGTGVNAFNSLFFMIAITRINGLEEAGIFTIAFSTACILYIIGIYAGRIYQVTENNKQITNKDYIVNRFISCFAIIIISIIFSIIRKYDIYKTSVFVILATYKALEAFSDVLYGIMQKHEILEKAGKSIFIKAILSIGCFILIDLLTHNLIISYISIIIVFLAVILIYDFKILKSLIGKELKQTKSKFKNVMTIFKSGFFTFAIAFLGLYMTNAPKYAIDYYLTEDIQAIFGIIVMPATVMGLLSQFLIHPYLNKIFELYNVNKYKEIKKIIYKFIAVILGFGIICSLLGYFLGTQVLGFVYGLDLLQYKNALFTILIGATFYTMAGIISPILVTMRCTKIQFVIYIIISIVEFLLCNIFVYKLQFNGAIWAYFITMFIYFITFYITSISVINNKRKLAIKEEKNL